MPSPLREAVSDAAWLAAMLDAERALARAEAQLEVHPAPPGRRVRRRRPGRRGARPRRPQRRQSRRAARSSFAGAVGARASRRDVAGHPRHGRRASRAQCDRADRQGAGRSCARVRAARRGAPSNGDGGAHTPAAGGADDVRTEGGELARRHRSRAFAPSAPAGAARRRGWNARGVGRQRDRGAARVRRGPRPA